MCQTDELDRSDVQLLRQMAKRVGAALPGQRGGSTVKVAQGPGQFVLWEVAR